MDGPRWLVERTESWRCGGVEEGVGSFEDLLNNPNVKWKNKERSEPVGVIDAPPDPNRQNTCAGRGGG